MTSDGDACMLSLAHLCSPDICCVTIIIIAIPHLTELNKFVNPHTKMKQQYRSDLRLELIGRLADGNKS